MARPLRPAYLELVAALRLERERSGLSQGALGQLLGRGQSWVSKVESGDLTLDLVETLELCRALDVRLSEIAPSALRPWVTPR